MVVFGAMVNTAAGKSDDVVMNPGSYWYQPGGVDHVTKCVAKTECMVFLSQPGPFDFVPVKDIKPE